MALKENFYIIDGSSYIFRAYYAIRPLSNSRGLPTHAVLGFTQMLLKLLKEYRPSHWVVTFDSKAPSFRKEKYPPYKANRAAPPEDLIPQFDYIKKVVAALRVPSLERPGFEADDIIATLVRRHLPSQVEAVIVSSDKDLMQLVNSRVVLLDTMKDKIVGIEGVREKFGVGPEQVSEVLALAGDSSDNIPGVPGIGPKTASQLVAQYGSLEAIYEHLSQISGKKKILLEEHRQQAFLSRELVHLADTLPIEQNWEDFRFQEADRVACQSLFQELEFHRLSKEFGETLAPHTHKTYRCIQTRESFSLLIERLRCVEDFSFDTETTSLDVFQAHWVGLALALAPGEGYYIPLGHLDSTEQLSVEEVSRQLTPLFADPTKKKYAQNFKYDAAILQKYGFEIRGVSCDTMLASYLLDPAQSHKLDALALKYLGHSMIAFSEVMKASGALNFSQVPIESACEYSAEDADMTYQLAKLFSPQLQEQGLWSLLQDIEMPLSEILLKMESWGIGVDTEFLKSLQKEFAEGLVEKENTIYALAGCHFNIQSPKQLGQILFETLGLPTSKKNKTGYSTDVEVLSELAKIHALPGEILAYRSLAKLKSTYVDALLGLVNPQTGRVHTHYNQTIAETGRLSSSDPNLQNIPIRTEAGAKIRRAFVAAPGYFFLSADYSQIELRVLAELSQDPVLQLAFENRQDIHRLTAASVFQVSESEVTATMRSIGKTLNFAVIYGQTPFGLAQQLGVSQKEAREYIERFFQKYSGVQRYRDAVLAQARQTGEVRTLFGRRRFVPELNSKNPNMRGLSERIAFNTVIQGTAADILKKAMIQIDRQMGAAKVSSRMLLQVHDELLFEVKDEESAVLTQWVREGMEKAVEFRIPLQVKIARGPSWGALS